MTTPGGGERAVRCGRPEQQYVKQLDRPTDVQAAPTLTKTFRHPTVGHITVDCDALTLTDRDQRLVFYGAPPGSPGGEALALLNVLGIAAGDHVP